MSYLAKERTGSKGWWQELYVFKRRSDNSLCSVLCAYETTKEAANALNRQLVERFLPGLGDCCAEFCHTTGIGQADVILCFARALMCSPLKPLRIGAEGVGTRRMGRRQQDF